MSAPAPGPGRALLTVLGDPARSAMYGHLAAQAGVQVVPAEGALHALTQLERTPVQAIICDALMPDMTGAEFCSVVSGDLAHSRVPVYLVPSAPDPARDQRLSALPAGPEVLGRAFRHLGVEVEHLPAPLGARQPCQLGGALGALGLPELLGWVAEQGLGGHWLVTTRAPGGAPRTGHLAMAAGRLTYAEFGGRSGRAALLALLRQTERCPGAEFGFFRTPDPGLAPCADFALPTDRLLIELAVDLDESSVR